VSSIFLIICYHPFCRYEEKIKKNWNFTCKKIYEKFVLSAQKKCIKLLSVEPTELVQKDRTWFLFKTIQTWTNYIETSSKVTKFPQKKFNQINVEIKTVKWGEQFQKNRNRPLKQSLPINLNKTYIPWQLHHFRC